MFATPISQDPESGVNTPVRRPVRVLRSLARCCPLAMCVALIGAPRVSAADTIAGGTDSAATAKATYVTARTRFQSASNNIEAAWQFARACFDRAVQATNNTDRAKMAEEI